MARNEDLDRHIITSAAAMRRLGGRLARRLNHGTAKRRNAAVVGLFGNLGSGKTTFAQGFARELGVRERVVSPTFVLMRVFLLPKTAFFRRLVHIDAYRMRDAREIAALGWEVLCADPRTVILVEWAERVNTVLPRGHLRVMFRHRKGEAREVITEERSKID